MKDQMMECFFMFLITMMISIDSLNAKLILVVVFSIDCRFLHGIGNKLLIWLHFRAGKQERLEGLI